MATLLHCLSLENPMDIGARGTMVHGVTKSGTRLKSLSMHTFLQDRKSYTSLYSSSGNCPKVMQVDPLPPELPGKPSGQCSQQ